MLFRYLMNKTNLINILIFSMLLSCTSNKTESETIAKNARDSSETQPGTSTEHEALTYTLSEDKSGIKDLYQLAHMKEWYPNRVLPPAFDFSMDISTRSVTELWLLRNEIFARNGYLFDDAVLRGHFSQFKWYQPVFDVPDFKVTLNQQEQSFINRVMAREAELSKQRFTTVGAHSMINTGHLYNRVQFKVVPQALNEQLAKMNFAIVPARHEQLFHVYDKNHYEYIPSFITTDLYLQVLHKHFSSVLRRVEENKFIPLLTPLLDNILRDAAELERSVSDPQAKRTARWTTVYLAIAHSLLTGEHHAAMPDAYQSELDKITTGKGEGSEFLQSHLIQYSQFVPRGNYTRSPELQNYFRCMKWLNNAPMYINTDERLMASVWMASCIRKSKSNLDAFNKFNNAIRFIVGDEDNLSIAHVITAIAPAEAANPSGWNKEKLNELRKKLIAINPDRIKPATISPEAAKELSEPFVLFTAGRYTFDAEILSKLVHVLQPSPHRPFPKGLDVFAALGNTEAERILVNEYHEPEQWDGYPDALAALQTQFKNYPDWNKNIYSKTIQTINSLSRLDARSPLFMKTPEWQRKNLVTSLAAWTELKHDMLLYAEQPYAAQAGEGGGPPPPRHIGYVEPNVSFWKSALELIDLQEKTLSAQGLLDDDIKSINEDLIRMATFLLEISEKELNQQPLDAKEFEEISWMGGRIEYLTFRIFDSDHLPEKERLVALVADVYRSNNQYLMEATGLVDELYVVVEINGKPYLTRGAVFSHYEFTNPGPLTDEQWQQRLLKNNIPARPAWTEKMMVSIGSLESKPEYSLLGAY